MQYRRVAMQEYDHARGGERRLNFGIVLRRACFIVVYKHVTDERRPRIFRIYLGKWSRRDQRA